MKLTLIALCLTLSACCTPKPEPIPFNVAPELLVVPSQLKTIVEPSKEQPK